MDLLPESWLPPEPNWAPCENTVRIYEHHLIETDRVPGKQGFAYNLAERPLKEEDHSVMGGEHRGAQKSPHLKILSTEEEASATRIKAWFTRPSLLWN